MKRLITQLALLIAVLCVSVQAHAYDCNVGGIYYNLNSSDNTAEVTYSYKYEGAIKIPQSVRYNGSSYSVTSIGEFAFATCSGLTSVTIPNSVMSIGNCAFYGCRSLTSVTIPNSVTSIGANAFYECTGLTSVTIGNSVTSIGGGAFHYCSGLTSLTIPASVTSIGEYAFLECTGLTSIVVDKGNVNYDSRDNCNAIIETATNTLITGCNSTIIPNSVTSIGNYAFRECTGLTSVTIPNSVTSIGIYAFLKCTGLTSVTIGNSVTSIGEHAFYGCSGLTSVTIPNSVTSIGRYAFSACSGLTSVTIPNSVTSIGERAFCGCSGLTSVTCLAPTPPECGDYALTDIDKSKCTLYVAKEYVSLYKEAEEWRDFYNIVGLLGVDDITVDADDAETLYDVYNMQGVKVGSGLRRAEMSDALPHGIYILVSPNATRKIRL